MIFLSWSYAERLCCWCRRASLSSTKRKAEESSTEDGSSDAAVLTSPRASPAKSRARRKEEKKQEEEEEASNRVSPPLQDVEMPNPPHDEGAAHVMVETCEVPAIKAERTRAEPSEGVRTPPAEEEAKEDESLGCHLVKCTKVAHKWVEVIL